MSASRTPGAAGNDVMLYSYTVPAASVTTAGLEHWIEVDDGVVREQTPTWPTVIGTVTVGTS
jgi:hypothetical protein